MTFKIERGSDGARSTIRLIGSVKSEHLSEIAHQLEICGPRAALDWLLLITAFIDARTEAL